MTSYSYHLSNRDYAHYYFTAYDLDAQLIAIRAFLSASRTMEREQADEIEALAQRAREVGSDHMVGIWTDEVHASVYHDAARSAAAVGMLAPFVENLFTGLFRGIGNMGEDVLGDVAGTSRSDRAKANFWDPHNHYGKNGTTADLVAGIMQLSEVSAIGELLPDDLETVLKALFDYRNRILHNGFEWPETARSAFGDRARNWPNTWFESATSNGKPWVWYMTETFIQRVLRLIEEVLEAAGQHLRLYYENVADEKG